MKKKITLREIAKLAKVSPATASIVLNDKKNPNFPSITFEEIEINTKILSHWINLV